MEAGEPAAAADVGVDVDGVAEIEGKVRGFLGGVSADHGLAGLVGKRGAEFFVNQGEGMLFGDGDVVLEVGVDVDVGLGLVVRLGVADEVPVGLRDRVHPAVGFQGLTAAPGLKPVRQVGVVDAREEEFFLVVAVEEGGLELLLEADEKVDDALGIGPTIDVVADEDQVVFGLRGNDVDHLLQGIEAAVDIANDKSSHGSGRGLAFRAAGVKQRNGKREGCGFVRTCRLFYRPGERSESKHYGSERDDLA